jgi:hypothetical protein
VSVTVDRTGLGPGDYTGTVTVLSNNGTEVVDISMTIPENPVLAVSSDSLDFGTEQSVLSFEITNAGAGTLTWNVAGDQTWITVDPTSGSTTTDTDQVSVTVDRTGLGPGDYAGIVTVLSNGGTEVVDISMTIPENPVLAVSPDSLDFGTEQTVLSFEITNAGTGTLTWNVAGDQTWITVDPTSGSTTTDTDQVSVTVDRTGLGPGDYAGSVTVSSNGGSVVVDIVMASPAVSAGLRDPESSL